MGMRHEHKKPTQYEIIHVLHAVDCGCGCGLCLLYIIFLFCHCFCIIVTAWCRLHGVIGQYNCYSSFSSRLSRLILYEMNEWIFYRFNKTDRIVIIIGKHVGCEQFS